MVGSKTDLEQQVTELIIEALDLEDVVPDDIDANENLFEGGLGLDSIDALEIAVALSQKYGIQVKADDDETVAVFRSVSSLAKFVSEQADIAS